MRILITPTIQETSNYKWIQCRAFTMEEGTNRVKEENESSGMGLTEPLLKMNQFSKEGKSAILSV